MTWIQYLQFRAGPRSWFLRFESIPTHIQLWSCKQEGKKKPPAWKLQSEAREVLHSSWKEAAIDSVLLHLFLSWNKRGDFYRLDKTQLQGILKWVKYIQNSRTRKSVSYAFDFAWGEILPAFEAPKFFEVKRCHIPDPGQKQGSDLCFNALLLFLTRWVISLLLFMAF